jgi:hypothetical protein
MSGEIRAIPRVKLPVVWTLGESWRAIAAIGGTVALQIVIFALTLEIVTVALVFARGLALGLIQIDDPSADAAVVEITRAITALVAGAIGMFLSVNLALATSRWVLFKERPPIESIFHWGRRQWRCLGVGLLCLLIILIPMAITVLAIRFLGGLYPGVPANVMAGNLCPAPGLDLSLGDGMDVADHAIDRQRRAGRRHPQRLAAVARQPAAADRHGSAHPSADPRRRRGADLSVAPGR